jgi:choline dehydrogenase-like flavoprotein
VQKRFFDVLLAHLQEGLFADPEYGGNRNKLGWKWLGHPGVWLENSAEEILRAMGATSTWYGPRFTGVGSSHELGGCRMSHEPSTSVVNADLAVYDTPGLYVCSGAVCPSCPGINPTLTLWALCVRAADRLAARLRSGEEL